MTEMAEAKYFIEYRKLSEGLDWNGWARIRFFGTLTYAEACEELLKQKKADDYVGERNFEYRIVNSDGLVVLRDGGEPAAPPASVEPSGKVLVPVEEWDRLKAVEARLEADLVECDRGIEYWDRLLREPSLSVETRSRYRDRKGQYVREKRALMEYLGKV